MQVFLAQELGGRTGFDFETFYKFLWYEYFCENPHLYPIMAKATMFVGAIDESGFGPIRVLFEQSRIHTHILCIEAGLL